MYKGLIISISSFVELSVYVVNMNNNNTLELLIVN